MTDIKDFSREETRTAIEFTMDGDKFYAAPVAPAMAVLDVARVNQAQDVEKLRIIAEFMDQILLPESAVLMAERLRSAERPVSVQQLTKVAVWLMEEAYATERPTKGPSSSPSGSGTTGPSSTDGAQPTA